MTRKPQPQHQLQPQRDVAHSRILVVEDEKSLAAAIEDLLSGEGYEVVSAGSLAAAQRCLKRHDVQLVVLDLTLPDGSGMDFLDRLPKPPQGPVTVVLTGDSSLETTIEAVRRGAYDYVPKPFDVEAFLHRLRNALAHHQALAAEALRARLRRLEDQSKSVLSLTSQPMAELHDQLLKVAAYDSMPVLVTGETGVGKEVVARMIHQLSPRSAEQFVAVNCADLDRNLLRSELFGHERGAFTGARERRRGLFELARRGTLLLDEVAEMPQDVQASFLRVLESGRFRRLGGTVELTTDVRIVASTNQDIGELARQGRFRQDLLYRLDGFELEVPSLRSRPEDCRALAEHFCRRIAAAQRISTYLTEDAYAALLRYRWPGNIRELKNVIERSVVIRGEGAITAADLRLAGRGPSPAPAAVRQEDFLTLAEAERRHVEQALELCRENRTQTAKLLGISRSTLIRKLRLIQPHS